MAPGVPPRSDARPSASFVKIGRFSLVTEIATGSLGPRWVGFVTEGPERGRIIIARRIRTAADLGASTLLERAAAVAKEVRHAKVAAVLEVVRTSSEVVIISEHIDGEPLSSLISLAALESSSIPTGVAVAIVRDLLDAEMAVRDVWVAQVGAPNDPLRRTVHGGLQPDCVLVASFGEALLTEFGVTGAATSLPRFARLASALPYRAPEQLDPKARIDERADVFTVGVMLWEMLTGQPLFGPADRLRRPTATGSVHELERQLREKPLATLDTVPRPSGPIEPEVAILVARALQRDPADRYWSLAELREAIDELPARMVAGAEEVATTVDRLARGRISARRAAFEEAVGGRVMGSAPPSSGDLSDLAPSSRSVAVIVPGADWRGGALPDLASFGLHELPTHSGTASPATVRGQRLPGPPSPPHAPVTAGALAAEAAPDEGFDDDIELLDVQPSTADPPGVGAAAAAALPDAAPAPLADLPLNPAAPPADLPLDPAAHLADARMTPPGVEPLSAPRPSGPSARAALVLAALVAGGLVTATLLLRRGCAPEPGPSVTVEPASTASGTEEELPATPATAAPVEPSTAERDLLPTLPSAAPSPATGTSTESAETPNRPVTPGASRGPRPQATTEVESAGDDDGRAFRPSGI